MLAPGQAARLQAEQAARARQAVGASDEEAARSEAGHQATGQGGQAQLRRQPSGRSAGRHEPAYSRRQRISRDRRVSPRRRRLRLRATRRQRARRRSHARYLHRGQRCRRRRHRRHGAGAAEEESANRAARIPRARSSRVIERETHQFVGTYFEARRQRPTCKSTASRSRSRFCVGDPGAKNAAADDKVVIEMVRFPTHSQAGRRRDHRSARRRAARRASTRCRSFASSTCPTISPTTRWKTPASRPSSSTRAIRPGRIDLTGGDDHHDRPGRRPRLRRRDLAGAHRQGPLAAGRAHRRRVALRAVRRRALDREAHAARHERLPARPRDPDAAGDHLQRPGQLAARPRALHQDRVHRVHARGHSAGDRADVGGDQEPPALHLRRSRRVPGRSAKPGARSSTRRCTRCWADMRELAMILRQRRLRRGALELTMPEVKIDLDKQGRVAGAHLVENTESHQIIEEFMLAANEAVAELAGQGRAAISSAACTQAPDPRKLQGAHRIRDRAGLSRSKASKAASSCKSCSATSPAGRSSRPSTTPLLRSLQRAVYSPEEEGHYALASECYCHFTSPIRRYPDLTIHRLLDAADDAARSRATILANWSCWASTAPTASSAAEAAERELTKVKLLDYLSTRIGTTLEAVVTGVEEFGLFVQGVELPAEGLVHVTSLADDFYRFDRACTRSAAIARAIAFGSAIT